MTTFFYFLFFGPVRDIVLATEFIAEYADIFKAFIGLANVFVAIVIAILFWPRVDRR